MIELKVGQMAVIAGIKVKCVEDEPQDKVFCNRCAGNKQLGFCSGTACQKSERKDLTAVHFVRARTKL